MRDPDPRAFSLRALEDKPPSVELLSPAFDAEISPRERLPVAFGRATITGSAASPARAVERRA